MVAAERGVVGLIPVASGFAVVTLVLLALAQTAAPMSAQEMGVVTDVEVEPETVEMAVGEEASITVWAVDGLGEEVSEAEFRYAAAREEVRVTQDQYVLGLREGEYEVDVSLFPAPDIEWEGDEDAIPSTTLTVRVGWPSIEEVEVRTVEDGTLYEGTSLGHEALAFHPDGEQRPENDVDIQWSTSDSSVATVDDFGRVTAHGTGSVEVTAEAEGTESSVRYDVEPFPAERVEFQGALPNEARAGDVLELEAQALDEEGNPVDDVPIRWSHTFIPDDSIGHHAGGSGLIRDDRFVGELPGRYSIVADAGRASAEHTLDVTHRGVVEPVEFVGQGQVADQHTSDLWVWEGVDGRDYAITGTWGADGYAFIWDVNDPENIIKTDSVQVDARTINDVKVSPDGRYATMTREGASDRNNGLVILDLEDPAHPEIAAEVDEGLAGGVHNAFPTEDHVYALSDGTRYLIFDVEDIYEPEYLSTVEYPGARIHDVWVKDGIAYSAQRPVGGVMVDVGDGRWGGSPEDPQIIGSTGPMPEGGGAHGVYPYYQESEDRMLLFLGDEILNREGRPLGEGMGRTLQADPYDPETGEGGTPSMSAGYLHILDVTDPEEPEKLASYNIPEAGTHNTWVEDDILYQAYWEGGVRMVDISGDLRGNLHEQDREIAVFKPFDPGGYIANAPFVWSAMPHGDHVFFSDYNSGLWAIEVAPTEAPIP